MHPTDSGNETSELQKHHRPQNGHLHHQPASVSSLDDEDEEFCDVNGAFVNNGHGDNIFQIQFGGQQTLDVCDIMMMSINANGNNTGSSCSSEGSSSDSDNDDNYDDSDYLGGGEEGEREWLAESSNCTKDFYGTTTTTTTTTEECSGETLYLNELNIDPDAEEQTITEMVMASEDGQLLEGTQQNRMRVAFGIILRLVLPLANGVARGLKGIRDVRFLRALQNLTASRQSLTNMLAYAANTISMSLSSVQVSHRIVPLLKLMKLRKGRDGFESIPDSPTTENAPFSPLICAPRGSIPRMVTNSPHSVHEEPIAPKCVTINIVAEPPPGTPIRADIVLIHGLHGSLVNTWKQGLWNNDRRPVNFQRPPKPPVRPPKRPRHSRSNIFRPPHKEKRARFADREHFSMRQDTDPFESDPAANSSAAVNNIDNGFSYECGEPGEIHMCDGMEYSFPTFRLRIDDNSRLLQAELEAALNGETDDDENTDEQQLRGNNRASSVDDPNYSKCWPGDWLPLDCPGVRVIAVNYTTDQYLWRPLWKKKEPRSNLVERSREMAELLIEHRVGYGHPIVWVGHSKGGLYVKQIIVDAWESGRPTAAPFWRSSRGVFFYSVPHRGSHLASIKAPLLTRSIELIDIEKNSKYLLDLHRRFAGLYQMGHLKVEVFSFVETALTLMSVLYMRIVGVDSADPGIGDVCGIQLDHRQICKPRSRECILYKELVKMINKVC